MNYAKLAEVLGARDVLDYLKETEERVKRAIDRGERIEIDLDFEKKIRDRLLDVLKDKFGEGLKVLKELAVIDLPIDLEVAKKVYDVEKIRDFVDLGLVEVRNNHMVMDSTLKDLIWENSEGHHRKALEYYSHFEESLDVMAEKAYHHVMVGDYDRAFELFMRCANEIYGRHRCVEKLIFVGEKLIGKVKEEDKLLGTLGNLYMVIKKYREAERYYNMVLKLYDENDRRYLGVLLNLANLHYVKGDYKKAEGELKELIAKSYGRDEEITEKALLILSSLYLDLGDYGKAESCLMDVLRMEHSKAKRDRERMRAVASIVNNLGYVYSRAKDFEKAEKFYKEALRIYNELNDVNGVTTVLNNLSSLYVSTQKIERAKETLSMIEKIKEVSPDLKAKYYFLKAKILEREGRLKEAMEHYMKAGALGFLVFRNFGTNAINYMHAFDKAEEIAKNLKLEDFAGDVFVLKSVIGKVYFGIKRQIGNVVCGERGRVILKALKGEKADFDVRDEVDSAVYVIVRDVLS